MTIPLTAAQRHVVETAEMVNFGSGPSAYAFEYRRSGIKGFNFGMTPSSFLIERPLLEYVAPILPPSVVRTAPSGSRKTLLKNYPRVRSSPQMLDRQKVL